MNKYITDTEAREAFNNAIKKCADVVDKKQAANLGGAFCAEIRDTAPSNVVEVVRCKDCVHHSGWNVDSFVYDDEKQKRVHRCEHKKGCYTFKINTPDDFYCKWGEKK